MNTESHILAFVRPLPTHSLRRQQAALVAHEPRAWACVGDNVTGWRDVIRILRDGDVLLVERIELLPEPRDKVRFPAQDLRDAIEAIEARGASIFEAATGRSTAEKADRAALIADAAVALAAGKGRRRKSDKMGRPVLQFSESDTAAALAAWKNLVDYPTWADVRAALPAGFTPHRCYRSWGSRGELSARARAKLKRKT